MFGIEELKERMVDMEIQVSSLKDTLKEQKEYDKALIDNLECRHNLLIEELDFKEKTYMELDARDMKMHEKIIGYEPIKRCPKCKKDLNKID